MKAEHRWVVTNLLLLLAQTVQNLSLNPPESARSPLAMGLSLPGATPSASSCDILFGKVTQLRLSDAMEDSGRRVCKDIS
jgi:hypothetical protein